MFSKVAIVVAILAIFSLGAGLKARAAEQKRGQSRKNTPLVAASVNGKNRASDPPVRAEACTITVDSSRKYQSIVGFGGAFTDAACYVLQAMPSDKRQALLQQLFGSPESGEDRLGLNFCRTCIGSSDYATRLYSYDEGDADPELKRFSIAHDEQYILPVIKEALAINNEIFLYSSPWSPPGWMKSNNSMLGGAMRRQYMPAYARYFAKFIEAYKAAGVNIRAVTVQNEVDTDQDGKMPACAWPQEYEVDFVRLFLGPTFKKEGIDTEIWIIDHNYNLWGRALSSLELPDLRRFVSAVAWHGYVGDAYRMSTVHDAYPEIATYWTEGGPDINDPAYQSDHCKWARTFTTNLNNWCKGITVWNLALDQEGKPNIGPFPCGGLVTVDNRHHEVSLSGQYRALAQFSRFIKRGAIRIGTGISLNPTSDIAAVACLNPDGQTVLVITNSGGAREVTVRDGKQSWTYSLAADSVSTLLWR